MTDKDNNSDESTFREAMNALGVKKHNSTPTQHSRAAKKKVAIPKHANNTDTQASKWPVILYKDLEAETALDNQGLSAQLSANSVLFHSGGLTQKNIKRLQRGQFTINSTLDLHGFTIDEAINELNTYINHYQTETQACCLIIHGKGYHSKQGGPKLKSLTERWLKRHPRVIAYCSAQAKDGGTGAVYVLLKH